MKGLFIPEITAEEFRNGCLESIEALMAEGAIYDIEYPQPCEDCISRNTFKRAVSELTYLHPTTDGRLEVGGAFDNTVYKVEDVWELTRKLPSVTPKYTDEEIQKMQELEQAQLEKAYELGKAESFEEWLSSFNTESATCCFTAVQQLKEKLNGQMD